MVYRSRNVKSRDINFLAKFSGETKSVLRSRDTNFPTKFSGKCTAHCLMTIHAFVCRRGRRRRCVPAQRGNTAQGRQARRHEDVAAGRRGRLPHALAKIPGTFHHLHGPHWRQPLLQRCAGFCCFLGPLVGEGAKCLSVIVA